MPIADWQAENLLRWLLDAELDIRWLDAQLAMRGEMKVGNAKALRYRRAELQRQVNAWSLRLTEDS